MAKKKNNIKKISETAYHFIDYHLERFWNFLDEDDLHNSLILLNDDAEAREYQVYKMQGYVDEAYRIEYYEFLAILSKYEILKKEEEKECFI